VREIARGRKRDRHTNRQRGTERERETDRKRGCLGERERKRDRQTDLSKLNFMMVVWF